ncbi:hypothetical protein [Nonomuraea sp. NPDC005650]|uniref:hypothetical protein n=1 Tax=Nonomuraea sp. NPDC005650 TaxID=3157045 RepID=UPI0033AF5C29
MTDPTNERHLLVINGEHEEEFSQWYRTVHIPEVVAAVPAIVSGRHFELAPEQPAKGGTELRRYLTVFEIEGDPAAAFAVLAEARAQGRIQPSPTSGRGASTSALFEPLITEAGPAGR